MLLRRITKHVKDQNWFAVGIDFFIVVVGVFIGLQVSNWNDARQERNNEAEYIQRLDAEIYGDTEQQEPVLQSNPVASQRALLETAFDPRFRG